MDSIRELVLKEINEENNAISVALRLRVSEGEVRLVLEELIKEGRAIRTPRGGYKALLNIYG